MFLIVNRSLVPKGYDGLAIYPFVILRCDSLRSNQSFINHEKIHIRQQVEMLIIPFYIWYVAEYLIRIVRLGDKNLAYRSISFEKEAYKNEKDPDYLRSRPFWKFLKYL